MAGDTSVRIDYVHVGDIHTSLAQRTAELIEMLGDLETMSRNMISSGGFEGQTEQAYYIAKQEWDTAANRMADLLGLKVQRLGNVIVPGYQSGDAQASKAFQNFAV